MRPRILSLFSARPQKVGRIRTPVAVAGLVWLACACQVAPMGNGLMETPTAAAGAASAPALAASAATGSNASMPGLLDLLDRPAERALMAGLRAYDDGQYIEAETQLRRAIESTLRSARDRNAARKQLAFIYCTTGRASQCEAEFRAALKDDPLFALSRGEAGHPMWGPVYKRLKPQ